MGEKTKNGITYDYIVMKLLLEIPEVTPKQICLFFETLSDFELLNEQGKKVGKILDGHVWGD